MPKLENSLTELVERTLTEEILNGLWHPGKNFPSENESMKRFQVSRVTIRRAYANLEEKNIIVRRKRYQTQVNGRLTAATDPITMVGALFPLKNDFSNEFLTSLNLAMEQEDALVVLPFHFSDGAGQNRAAMSMVRHGIRNMIVWGCDHSIDMEMYRRFRLLGINLVFFDHIHPGNIADYVSIDSRHAISMLLDKALADGCREFVFLNTADLQVDSNADRQHHFEVFCCQHGLPYRLADISWKQVLATGAPAECRAFFEQIPNPEHTGIFCANAYLAKAVSQAVGERGRYYSISTAELPLGDNIITMRQPMQEMAKTCFDLLCAQQQAGSKWQSRDSYIKGTPMWK
jgi:DNA-binding LacI/PurR family transcriptional regulator